MGTATNYGWKQPTPTNINSIPELNFIDRAIFREILSLCQNKDTVLHFIHSNKNFAVELKRGQCILKASKIALDLKMGRRVVRNSIVRVSKWYNELNIKGMPFGLVVTVLNYDEITNLDNERNNEGTMKEQSRYNEGTANKSVKSDKLVKSDKHIYVDDEFNNYLKRFNELYSSKHQTTLGRKEKFKARLKSYSSEQIMVSLETMAKIPFFKGKNDRNWVPTPDYLLKNDENIDKMLNNKGGVVKGFANENTERFNNL